MGKVESVENEICPYVSPQVELIMVKVEKGFADSSSGTEGYDDNNKEIEF